jgi:hypothetical protein
MLASYYAKVVCSNAEHNKSCADPKGHKLAARAIGTASQKVSQLICEVNWIQLKKVGNSGRPLKSPMTADEFRASSGLGVGRRVQLADAD